MFFEDYGKACHAALRESRRSGQVYVVVATVKHHPDLTVTAGYTLVLRIHKNKTARPKPR